MSWFTIDNIDAVDSPALVLYPDRIRENIVRMVAAVGSADRLRPHIKTHKMAEIVRMQMQAGIVHFKCATIAEAEMLAQEGVASVLLAYQPVGPKIQRLLQLVQKYREVVFYALVDNESAAEAIAEVFAVAKEVLPVWLDIDVGMHRTGIPATEEAWDLYLQCKSLRGIQAAGLHVYDGHLSHLPLPERRRACDAGFAPVQQLADRIAALEGKYPRIIAGGTPTFPIHAQREDVVCSPGTSLLWDWGYAQTLPELNYLHAALVVSRVISRPTGHIICTDLGHKSVAADKPLPRVHFLNLPDARVISQSEEHLVLEVADSDQYPIGSVLYGVPVHICPTCALYDRAYVVENGMITQEWEVSARSRKITI